MVRALLGDSTITSRVPCTFAAAPFPVPVPLAPLSEATFALLAALLLAGTLFSTSHQRHGRSRRRPPVTIRRDPRRKYHTRRGHEMPVPALIPATVDAVQTVPVWSCALRRLAHNKRTWPSTTTSSCTCRAERPATPRGAFLRITRSTASGNWPDSGCTPTAAGRLPSAVASYAPYGHSDEVRIALRAAGFPGSSQLFFRRRCFLTERPPRAPAPGGRACRDKRGRAHGAVTRPRRVRSVQVGARSGQDPARLAGRP